MSRSARCEQLSTGSSRAGMAARGGSYNNVLRAAWLQQRLLVLLVLPTSAGASRLRDCRACHNNNNNVTACPPMVPTSRVVPLHGLS
jgi:hypothetical protein